MTTPIPLAKTVGEVRVSSRIGQLPTTWQRMHRGWSLRFWVGEKASVGKSWLHPPHVMLWGGLEVLLSMGSSLMVSAGEPFLFSVAFRGLAGSVLHRTGDVYAGDQFLEHAFVWLVRWCLLSF